MTRAGQPSLRVAIIGAGWMGREHARAVVHAGDTVTAVVDEASGRADDLVKSERLPTARSYTSIRELLASNETDQVTAAVIATPSLLHLDQVRLLISAGLPVLVEKPPWIVGQNPRPVLELAATSGTIVAVGMTTRFDPGVQQLRSAVAAGELGDIYSVSDEINFRLAAGDLAEWYFTSPYRGGGVLLTNGVHSLDRVGWILGGPLRLTSSARRNSNGGRSGEDMAILRLDAARARASGAQAEPRIFVSVSLLWSGYEPPSSRLQVIGSDGAAWTDGDGTWTITTGAGVRSGRRPASYNGYYRQWQAFHDRVTGGRSLSDALPTLDELQPAMDLICEAVADPQRSARRGDDAGFARISSTPVQQDDYE
jgi:predicted dehydrogenase